MVATSLTCGISVTVIKQMKAEIKKVINCIMSDVFQGMYIDMCKMMLSAKMVELSKSHKNINQNEFKGNLWINMLAGLAHPQIIIKKHLIYGWINKRVELMLLRLFLENVPLLVEILWDSAVTDLAHGQN